MNLQTVGLSCSAKPQQICRKMSQSPVKTLLVR
nr:MAG TPA: hypothetical protein [Caudoviricetes sp.]